jgi:steroid delta-isomerase
MGTKQALDRFRAFYDTFSMEWVERLDELYAPAFDFSDPFHVIANDRVALRRYFTKILTALHFSQFVVEDTATGEDGSYVRWRWKWQRRSRDPIRIVPGVTHLRFLDDDRIVFHRDLFDAAQGFYEALPILGTALRIVRRRIS